MTKNDATLRDVAKRAGVSVGTVSHFINNNSKILEKNKCKIQKAIDDLGYTPNSLAQNFAKGISKQIALYISAEFPISSATWMYGLPIIQGVNSIIHLTGYSLQMSVNSINDIEKSYENISKAIINRSIDGLLYLSAWQIPMKILELLTKNKFPYILVANNNPLGMENDVLIDIPNAVSKIVNYLYDNGHRTYGIVLGYKDQIHMAERLQTFYSEMNRLKLPVLSRHIKTGSFDISSGYALMLEMISEGDLPSAIICGNDDIATGVIKALKESGVNVPRDVSVIGFDNSIVGQVSEPAITTMDIPAFKIGEESAKNLIYRISNPGLSVPRSTIPCTLVEYGSVAKCSSF